jgi:predicted ATPase
VFTDIEGSTRLLEAVGTEAYAQQLMLHRQVVRQAVADHDGLEIGTQGDGFFLVFPRAPDALGGVDAIQKGLANSPVRVRIGVHSGESLVVDGDYVGLEVHKAARICAAAHGGQVLVSQATAELAGGDMHDLGEFRLKDLVAPERLFQMGGGEFALPRALRQAHLPVQPTPLIGRHTELTEIAELVRKQRLVTLTGPGGSGKTRLALQVAARLAEEYADGVWWVSMAAISDPDLVMPTIAQTLGADADLADYLAPKRLLLLLDNLEQVLDAAPYLIELLAAAPDCRLLVTSRERLAVSGEQEYPVPPLDDPAASELFITRAKQVKPDFNPDGAVEEICRRLDRLPLALELASTRVKLMTTGQILARLDHRFELLTGGGRDKPARQETLRAAFDWSYDLLSITERKVFRSLGVFVGNFEHDAARAVCSAGLEQMQSLVDKSLVRPTSEGRFFLLETVREYALDRLDAADETEECRRYHAQWYLRQAMASRSDREEHGGFRSAPDGVWVERLATNVDNFRAAFAWALEYDASGAVELATTLARPWQQRGHLREVIRSLGQALEASEATDPTLRAQALRSYGEALLLGDQQERAAQAATESLRLFRREENLQGEADALILLGNVVFYQGVITYATELHEQALTIYRLIGDRAGIGLALHVLGETLREAGELVRAGLILEEAATVARDCGNRYGLSHVLIALGDLALDRVDGEEAAQRYHQSLAIAVELADERGQAYCLAGLACKGALDGDARVAGRLWAAVEEFEARSGIRMLEPDRHKYETKLAPLRHDPAFRAGQQEPHPASLQEPYSPLPRPEHPFCPYRRPTAVSTG